MERWKRGTARLLCAICIQQLIHDYAIGHTTHLRKDWQFGHQLVIGSPAHWDSLSQRDFLVSQVSFELSICLSRSQYRIDANSTISTCPFFQRFVKLKYWMNNEWDWIAINQTSTWGLFVLIGAERDYYSQLLWGIIDEEEAQPYFWPGNLHLAVYVKKLGPRYTQN